MSRKKIIIFAAAACGLAAIAVLVLRARHWNPRLITFQGAIIRRDADPRKESPIADAIVTASDGTSSSSTRSDNSGYFKLEFHERVWPARPVTLHFEDPDYYPLDMQIRLNPLSNLKRLYIARLRPVESQAATASDKLVAVVKNIRVRYTVNVQTEANIGTEVKPFQITNKGDIPCDRRYPCSPNGMWKASAGSVTLDAGPGNEFRNVRASCIAGPCPFTRIDRSGYIQGGRTITASALDWSDTATFLLEAEVFHDSVGSSVRESYPVIYGRTMHFTLPPSEEGVSIEADLNKVPMVFPLGEGLYLSWATCTSRTGPQSEKSAVYQCELKPGYRF
jgi:hypothetical protein